LTTMETDPQPPWSPDAICDNEPFKTHKVVVVETLMSNLREAKAQTQMLTLYKTLFEECKTSQDTLLVSDQFSYH
jgi:hypothetical protein